MLKTLAARVVFAPNDIEDAKQISEELGATTVNVKSRSFPSFFRNGNRSASVTVSEQRRLLMLPQEVKEMGMDAELVFYERLRPIRCQKIRYYADPRFARRVMPAPAIAPLTLPERGRGRTDDHFALWQHHIAGATLPVRANAQAPRHAQAPTSGHPEPPARGAIDAASAAVIAAPPAAQAFSLDFSAIEIPPGRTLTDTELKHAVDRFFEDLQAG
jgi:type IV secretion system protein VirD4